MGKTGEPCGIPLWTGCMSDSSKTICIVLLADICPADLKISTLGLSIAVKQTEAAPALGLPGGRTWHGTGMCHRHGMCGCVIGNSSRPFVTR
jgi:hypothetical protein